MGGSFGEYSKVDSRSNQGWYSDIWYRIIEGDYILIHKAHHTATFTHIHTHSHTCLNLWVIGCTVWVIRSCPATTNCIATILQDLHIIILYLSIQCCNVHKLVELQNIYTHHSFTSSEYNNIYPCTTYKHASLRLQASSWFQGDSSKV